MVSTKGILGIPQRGQYRITKLTNQEIRKGAKQEVLPASLASSLRLLSNSIPVKSQRNTSLKSIMQAIQNFSSPFTMKTLTLEQRRKKFTASPALPENAVSVVLAATVVGAAATVLVRTTRASKTDDNPIKTCEDCGGSGICAECKGEGFVLKKLSEESAEKARLAAKNMATRYTAGLPKKWSYCTKCSSARSCSTCGGSGKLSG